LLVAMTPQGARRGGLLVDREGVVTLVRIVDFERHLLRLPEESWAVDERILREAEAEGVERVEIQDERGRMWWTTLTYLLERGERFDRGWGAQVRLPLTHWSFRVAARGANGQKPLGLEGQGG